MTPVPLRPLVVGPPRSGFTLLSSVLVHLAALAPSKWEGDLRQRVLNGVVDTLGWSVSDAIVAAFAQHGVTDDLIYNRNFRELTGGPKWLDAADPERACFRKYIGVRGKGDFNLITAHPRATLDHDIVVHSHVDPPLWLTHPGYAGYRKFASIRNPIGILNSSIFSLNALASEYIQKFVPPEDDRDELRQHLALYKMTDLTFFAGLASHLKRYLESFLGVRDGYALMRWEDLIDRPVPTIQAVGAAAGVSVSEDYAALVWSQLDHRNLTGAHKHNYRAGFGIVGNWRDWLTNHHLRLIRDMGLGPAIAALGYDPDETLDEAAYTPFQREVNGLIARGRVFDDYPDRDLFTFAFNKSNIDIEKFPFRRYPWRAHTQIERSCLADIELEQRAWDAAEAAAGRLNRFLDDLLAADLASPEAARISLDRVFHDHDDELGRYAPERFAAARAACLEALAPGAPPGDALPRLVRTVGVYNIVHYGQRFYGLPQALGPIDLAQDDVTGRPGVVIGDSLASVEQRVAGLARAD
jgi:hypothetical protein